MECICSCHKKNTKDWYLVDCGEGTQHSILKTNLSLKSLQAICITHVHGDHCYGLPGLLASAGMVGRKDKLTIIAPNGIEQFMSAKKVAKFANSIGLHNLVLTHFSARYSYSKDKPLSIYSIEQEAKNYYSGNLFLANDFDMLCLDKNGYLSYKKYGYNGG